MVARSPHEPLKLADGTIIDPSGSVKNDGKKVTTKSVRKHAEQLVEDEKNLKVDTRKTLSDLPLPPKQMHVIGLVCFYTNFGLIPIDVAIALDITEEQVKLMQESDAYTQAQSILSTNFRNAENQDIQGILDSGAKRAARKIVELIDDTEEDSHLNFSASQDVLNRSGFRPVDVVEHKHNVDGELRIEYIKTDNNKTPTIDLDYELVEEQPDAV